MSLSIRVYYEDTDAGGVVYYANYLNFLERARTEWFRQLGFNQSDLIKKHKIAFVVKSIQIEFHQAARLDDEIKVSCELAKRKNCSILFNQKITNEEKKITSAQVLIACVKVENFQPQKIPTNIIQKILCL